MGKINKGRVFTIGSIVLGIAASLMAIGADSCDLADELNDIKQEKLERKEEEDES